MKPTNKTIIILLLLLLHVYLHQRFIVHGIERQRRVEHKATLGAHEASVVEEGGELHEGGARCQASFAQCRWETLYALWRRQGHGGGAL